MWVKIFNLPNMLISKCYRPGAFLIPYLLLLFVVGRPIYYLELIIGQFSGRGPIQMWKCVPAIKGVGFAQLFSVSYVAIFYNYLMGVSVFYFAASFSSTLPWSTCHQEWVPEMWCETHPNATSYQNQTWPDLYSIGSQHLERLVGREHDQLEIGFVLTHIMDFCLPLHC